ncbi:carboxylesterase type B, partial [Hyphomonas adhaerens MHS-3]
PPPPPPAVPTSQTDVVYGSGLLASGSKSLLLDVYQSGDACTAARPLVVLVHGGGFEDGTKQSAPWPSIASDLSGQGYVAISIDYRLAGDNPVPSAEFYPVRDAILNAGVSPIISNNQTDQANIITSSIEDTTKALRWIEDNSADLCVDMSRFAIWGGSAGSVIGLHISYGLDEYSIYAPKPEVMIDYWGRFIYSGLMDAGEPPLLILHGDQDDVVDYSFAQAIQTEADSNSISYAFYTVSGARHSFGEIPINSLTIDGKTLLQITYDFIDAHLQAGTPVYETRTVPLNN